MATEAGHIWIMITLTILLLCSLTGRVKGYHDYCMLDDDGLNPQLGSCLNIGEKFLSEYTHLLKKGKTPDNTCKLFEAFNACISPLLADCASVNHVLRSHWLPVIDFLQCSCNSTLNMHDCHSSMQCFEHESSNMMFHSCDQLYRLNRRLKTRKRCHFLRESIHCKVALLKSACNHRTGKFGHHFSMLTARQDIEKLRCYVQPDATSYAGFSYSERCPSDLQTSLLKCRDLHPPSQWMLFDKKYTYIPRDGRRLTIRACSTYSQYRTCLKPLLEQCPEGVERLHSIDGHLRTYMIMMDYICLEVLDEFASHASCYKEVMRNNSLQCSLKGLEPYYENVTSHMFYCASHDKQVLAMQQVFEVIRSCIETHMSHQCGSASGSVISELVRRVFADPFRFQPNCRVHNVPVSSSTTPSLLTPSSSSSEVRSRPLRVAGHNKSTSAGVTLHRTLTNLVSMVTLWTLLALLLSTQDL